MNLITTENAAEKALNWAAETLDEKTHAGEPRQNAVNDVLITVARVWGPDSAHAVERALDIHFKMPRV
ncbi:MAG: hypothetical protein WA823_08635 [Candidatus Acidiferrales bacterium]